MTVDKKAELNWRDERKPVGQRVEEWLRTTGFPLEFRTAEALIANGFSASQGLYLPGDDAENGLEVDVLGSRRIGVAEFHLLIECKVIPPGTIWTGLKEPIEYGTGPGPNEGIGRTDWAARLQAEQPQFFSGANGPAWGEAPALALRTVTEPNKRDEAFFAVQGLATRTRAMLVEKDGEMGWSRIPVHASMVVPTLVVDGELASATWDLNTRDFKGTAVDVLWVAWKGYSQWPLPFFALPVVRIDALPDFANRLRQWAEAWCAATDKAHAVSKDAAAKKATVTAAKSKKFVAQVKNSLKRPRQ